MSFPQLTLPGCGGAEGRAVVPLPPSYTPTKCETILAVSWGPPLPGGGDSKRCRCPECLESQGTKLMTLCSAGLLSQRQGWRSYPAHPVYYWPSAEAWEREGQRRRVETVREEEQWETQEIIPSCKCPFHKEALFSQFPRLFLNVK